MILSNQRCLEQAVELIDLLDDNQYASPRGTWSAVGAQLRHVIEHYQSFIDGLPDNRIDYDARRRDPLLETSRKDARQALKDLSSRFDALLDQPATRAVAVQMMCNASNPAPVWTTSTMGRELQFLVSHSVHHFALIKLLLAGDGVPLSEDFGTAPSTVVHASPDR